MNIPRILEVIRPGEQWTLRGDSIDDLEWHDSTPKPTLEELQDGESKVIDLSYRDKRSREYPLIGDQLDALWKGGDDAAQMLAKIQAVKNKFPKPF